MIRISATVPLQYPTIYSPFSPEEFDDALEWSRKNGFCGVELCISDPAQVQITDLNTKLSKYGLAVSTISTGQARALEGLSLTDEDLSVREKTVNRIKDHLRLATKIGLPLVTIGLLRGLGTSNKERDLEYLAQAMDECAAYAQREGVTIVIEPINRYETTLLNTVDDTLKLITGLCCQENVGVLFDTFHANIEEISIAQSINKLGDKLRHVHFADSDRYLPGQGQIDFSVVVASLQKNNFSGYVSLETLNLPTKEAIKKEAADCLHRALGYPQS